MRNTFFKFQAGTASEFFITASDKPTGATGVFVLMGMISTNLGTGRATFTFDPGDGTHVDTRLIGEAPTENMQFRVNTNNAEEVGLRVINGAAGNTSESAMWGYWL